MSVTVYPPAAAGLTTADRDYIADESTSPSELAAAIAAIPAPDVEGDVAAYGTAKTTDVTDAQAAIIAALQPEPGTIRQFKAGEVPAGWTQFSGPPASYSGYTAVSVMPGIGHVLSSLGRAFAVTPQGLHVLGNVGGTAYHQRFDEPSGAWVTLPNPPLTLSGAVSLGAYVPLTDGRVLFASVSASTASSAARMYDPATEAWTSVANMPAACRGGGGERLPDGRIYVCGDAASAYIYDPATNSWSTAAKCPGQSTFTWQGYCRLPSGKLLAVSGTSYYVYDHVADSWSTGTLPGGISTTSGCCIPTATGAMLSTATFSDTAAARQWLYTEATDSWAASSVVLVSCNYSNAGQLSDGTWVFGAASGLTLRVQADTTPAATVWAYKN